MQEEEKQNHSAGTPPEQPKKHKKEKGKSLLETMREIDAKEAEKEAEAEKIRAANNGSSAEMDVNIKLNDLTEERCRELLEYLKN